MTTPNQGSPLATNASAQPKVNTLAVVSPAPLQAKAPISSGLAPIDGKRLSAEMRMLLGASPYSDPSQQVDADQLLAVLAAEFKAGTTLQMLMVQDLTEVILALRQNQRAKQTAIAVKVPQAAREILCAGWDHFNPPATGRCTGNLETAYGEFLSTASALAVLPMTDDEAIAGAETKLAGMGRPAGALSDFAMVLALSQMEKLAKIRDSLADQRQALVDQLFRLMDRRESRGFDKAA
jgi:hypothetical protein